VINFPEGTKFGEIPLDFDAATYQKTLYQALCEAARTYGLSKLALEDTSGNPKTDHMDYKKLMTFANILAAKLSLKTKVAENVGILLPNINANVATFFALSRIGRVPAMLQYIVEPENAYSACETAQIKTVITAKNFLKKATEQGNTRPQAIVTFLAEHNINIIYLEDIAQAIHLGHKLKALFTALLDSRGFYPKINNPHDPAVVLFTSGSEGAPKGVVLSHANILSNHQQVINQVSFNPAVDVVFNALPMFHCFGLLTATLLPLLQGMKTFLHTNPKDAAIIPALMHKAKATITFGTDSFFNAYAAEVLKDSSPYDPKTIFKHLRFAWAGAEALKEETRHLWQDKFGVVLLQGYGVTETSPVISLNLPNAHMPTSVGQFLPGMHYALQPVEGFDNGFDLFVKGPQVMLGYLEGGKLGVLTPPPDGWHNTGDVVNVDEQGYLFIVGRLSRFIKVKGEKVPLSVAEAIAKYLWPEAAHGAAKCTDKTGKEHIILFSTTPHVDLKKIEAEMTRRNIPLRHMPKTVQPVVELPLLGSGKLDLVTLDKQAAKLA